jgi:hypothetical protein
VAKKWHTVECKYTELEATLNRLEGAGYTIFSIIRLSGGYTDNILVVFNEQT